jgi:predicted nucleic acid-binding Zn ribbon protein
MTFEPLRETLDKSLKRSPVRSAALAVKVENAVKKEAPSWVEMVSFKDGKLTLSVPSPSHAQEIYIKSRDLTRKINEEVGGKTVEKIRFRTTGK